LRIHNREPFLNHVAENLGRKRHTEVKRPKWSVEPQRKVYEHLSQESLVALLKEQCKNIHTKFKRIKEEQLIDVLFETIQSYNAQSIVMPDDPRNDRYRLPMLFQKLKQHQYNIHLWKGKEGDEHIQFAKQADIGIVFSDITLAESGTVTLCHHKNHGRALSVLPETFLAIIPTHTIVPRLTQAMQKLQEKQLNGENLPSCISFVSGPSNSADIEMNLMVGVHGPVRATYIVVDD